MTYLTGKGLSLLKRGWMDLHFRSSPSNKQPLPSRRKSWRNSGRYWQRGGWPPQQLLEVKNPPVLFPLMSHQPPPLFLPAKSRSGKLPSPTGQDGDNFVKPQLPRYEVQVYVQMTFDLWPFPPSLTPSECHERDDMLKLRASALKKVY